MCHFIKQQLWPGEGDDANAGVELVRERLPAVLKDVSPDLSYNLDEISLIFCQMPTRLMASAHGRGGNRIMLTKNRLTVGLFANATGTDKFLPVVIRTAKSGFMFDHVAVVPLPQNMISAVQRLHAGIKRAFRAAFCWHHVF